MAESEDPVLDRLTGNGNPPKLLFVINHALWFLTHRIPIARAARERGWEVHVAAPDHPASRKIGNAGFTFHPVRIPRKFRGPHFELWSCLSLVRLFRRVRPEIVHNVTTRPVLYGSWAGRLAGVEGLVNAVAGLGYVFMADGVRGRALRTAVEAGYRVALAHPCSRTIFQNSDDLRKFVEAGLVKQDDAVLIRGAGVDTSRFSPSPEPAGRPVVLFASRMLWDKGVGDLVAAANLLRAREVGCRVVLVGEPDPANPTSVPLQTLSEWHEGGAVEWKGFSSDMVSELRAASVVVLPSYREGLPKVLIEAAAVGRSIVTNDVPGCREVVRDGENGFLVPSMNPEALADAIETLVKDPGLRRRFGARGREIAVSEFAQEIVVARTLEVYEDLLGG